MWKIAAPAAAALALVGFAATTQSADRSASSADAGWHLLHDGEMAKLAYGEAQSDNIALMVACEAGTREAHVYGVARPVSLIGRTASGVSAPDPLSGGDAIETVVPVSALGLDSLKRPAGMAVREGERTFRLTADAQEQHAVDRFLNYCGSSST